MQTLKKKNTHASHKTKTKKKLLNSHTMASASGANVRSSKSTNGLNFDVTVRAAQCVDFETAPTRNGQKKWTKRGEMCTLNRKYPLSIEERDQINFGYMLKIFKGEVKEMEKYFSDDSDDKGALFIQEQADFLENNKGLFERFLAQKDVQNGPRLIQPYAKHWLYAHGIKPQKSDRDIEKQVHVLMRGFSGDKEKELELFDVNNIRAVLEATGFKFENNSLESMIDMYRDRILRDDANRPVELADFSSAIFVMDKWKLIHGALHRGVGAKPLIAVTTAELQAELRALGLPWNDKDDTLTRLWQRLNLYMYRSTTRKNITDWLNYFGFELSKPRTDERLNPDKVSKRVLFDAIGHFVTGTVEEDCDMDRPFRSPAFEFTSNSTVRNFLEQQDLWRSLLDEDRRNTELKFKIYCAEKVLRNGFIVKVDQGWEELKPTETALDLIDELLEEGYWGTTVLSECQKERVKKHFGFDYNDRNFVTKMRDKLNPYITDQFCFAWLKVHRPGNLEPNTSLKEAYVQASVCSHGVATRPGQTIVKSNNREIDKRINELVNNHQEPQRAPASEFANMGACKNLQTRRRLGDDAGQIPGEPDDKFEVRRGRVRMFFELIDSYYMTTPEPSKPGKLFDLYFDKVSKYMVDAKLWTAVPDSDEDKRRLIWDFNLWVESMASEKVLKLLIGVREIENLPGNPGMQKLLQIISSSNYERFAMISGWSDRRDTGELCWKGNTENLNRKLQLLHVPYRELSLRRKVYMYMHLLSIYLPDGVKLSLLPDLEYKRALEDKDGDPFAKCFERYCARFQADKESLALIVRFNPDKAGSIMLSWAAAKQVGPEQKSEAAADKIVADQGFGCVQQIVTQEMLGTATIVDLITGSQRRILNFDKETKKVEHYLASLDGKEVAYLEPFDNMSLLEIVQFFQSNGDTVHRIGEDVLKKDEKSRIV